MNYAQTIDFLFNSVTSFQQVGADAYKPGLERVEEFCRRIGNPQNSFCTIHVAGTNGKGSVSSMLASVLRQAGYKVGLYTSPHLVDFRERIRVDGRMIPQQDVVDFVGCNYGSIKELQLSFFEITTAMAFSHFALSGVEVAVIETGLGGRLDATNIIRPLVSVVTNIGLDHTALLGDTLQAVAAEKAGIIKSGVGIILGEGSESYNNVFEARSAACGSQLIYAEQCYSHVGHRLCGGMQTIELQNRMNGKSLSIEIDLLGECQYHNVITAATVVDYLNQNSPLTISCQAFREGMSSVVANSSLQGRWQVVGQNPLTVYDTGHNAHGIRYVAEQISRFIEGGGRAYCVIGFARDKSLDEVLELLPRSAYYLFTAADSPRSLPATQLCDMATAAGLSGECAESVKAALQRAREMATANDMIFVGGSNFVVAEVL